MKYKIHRRYCYIKYFLYRKKSTGTEIEAVGGDMLQIFPTDLFIDTKVLYSKLLKEMYGDENQSE